MQTTARFNNAIEKLYQAFHNNQLHPECAMQCAVGNICDQKDSWKHFSDAHGSLQLNYVGRVHEVLGRTMNGYTPSELLRIEREFLIGCGYTVPLNHRNLPGQTSPDKNQMFDGLCAAVGVLCRLDHLPDAMDIAGLFDYQPGSTVAFDTTAIH